jgi:tetraacyldisaccharide 4'-kinase
MKAIRYLLFPLAVLYDGVTAIRNTFYDQGIFKSTKFHLPVIAVGNLSVGGTGKSPMIEYLIRLLKNKKVATLSRGYKRKTEGFILIDSNHTASDVGDEPLQFYKKFPEIKVAVDANRVRGIQQLQKKVNPEVVLLDDAYQHRKVRAGCYILLTKYDDLFSDDLVLPTGNLRESSRGANRADVIVVTKCPKKLTSDKQESIKKRLQSFPDQPVFFSTISYHNNTKGNDQIPLKNLKEYEVCLVTGIANPQPLLEFLKVQEVNIHHEKFPDHHEFSSSDIEQILRRYDQISSKKKLLLTTEKDYMRLSSKISNLSYIEIESQFLNDEDLFNRLILHYCNTKS